MVSYQLAESRSQGSYTARGSRYSPCGTISGASKVRRAVEVSQCKFAYWLFRLFSRHISRTQSFQQNRHINFHALVALKLLVSLISRLVACSARIVVDRQTDRQTDKQTNRQTDTQTKYCNPRCACAPRVNDIRTLMFTCIVFVLVGMCLCIVANMEQIGPIRSGHV